MPNIYCSLSQFLDQRDLRTVAQLSSDTNSQTPDTARVQRLLDLSASTLDSYLTGRYPTPIPTPVPGVLTEMVANMTMAKLFARRTAIPQEIKDALAASMQWLNDLAKGLVSLPGIARQYGPQLIASDQIDGTSRMDGMPFVDAAPTPTSTGGGLIPPGPLFGQ